MSKLEELEKELKETRDAIEHKQKDVDYYKKQEKDLIKQIEMLEKLESPMINATNLWCRLTNALIAKYKPMTEENPNKAVKELIQIEGALLTGGYLTKEELDKAL